MKKETKEALGIILIFIIIVIIVFFVIRFFIPDYNEVNACFEEAAITYCETNNMMPKFSNRIYFSCYESNRSLNKLEFRYTEEEREECYKLFEGWSAEK